MRDDALLRISESGPSEYTAEARALIEAEVGKRGGPEALKEQVSHAGETGKSREELARLRRFFVANVMGACGLFIFALNGSSWFYWICLFALIAVMFAVLFNPPANPEDEIKELLEKAKEESSSPVTDAEEGHTSATGE